MITVTLGPELLGHAFRREGVGYDLCGLGHQKCESWISGLLPDGFSRGDGSAYDDQDELTMKAHATMLDLEKPDYV